MEDTKTHANESLSSEFLAILELHEARCLDNKEDREAVAIANAFSLTKRHELPDTQFQP